MWAEFGSFSLMMRRGDPTDQPPAPRFFPLTFGQEKGISSAFFCNTLFPLFGRLKPAASFSHSGRRARKKSKRGKKRSRKESRVWAPLSRPSSSEGKNNARKIEKKTTPYTISIYCISVVRTEVFRSTRFGNYGFSGVTDTFGHNPQIEISLEKSPK